MCLLRRPVRLRVGVFFGASSNGGERHGCVRRPPGAPDRDVYDLEHDGGVRRVRRLSAGARGVWLRDTSQRENVAMFAGGL